MSQFYESDEISRRVVQQMSPRQLALNVLYSWFETTQYDNRKMDWNGTERLDTLAFESAAVTGYIPSGFQVITDNKELPLKFRRPTAPYNLVRVVVERFTSMLFSARRQPRMHSETEPETSDWLTEAARVGRLWPAMLQARNFGGATGTAIVGFVFVNGLPKFEAHDPRWCFPTFSDQAELELEAMEKKYPYEREEWNAERFRYEPAVYWYRRVIDAQTDTLYEPLSDATYQNSMRKGRPVPWVPKRVVKHGFGECPIVWIHNLPVAGAVDGIPDCHGIYDTAEAIDALYAQANAGTLANCDPTLLVKTDSELGDLALGRGNVVKLNQNDDGKYLEIDATGIKAARELAEELRERALEVVSCVIDNNNVGDRATATEVERVYSAMLAKCDVLREQYGVKGVTVLMQKLMRAVRAVEAHVQPPASMDEAPTRMRVQLPPRVEILESGESRKIERKFGTGADVETMWGPYFTPSMNDTKQASDAVALVRAAKVVDLETAVRFLRDYFGVTDVQRVLEQLRQERAQEQADESAKLDAELQAQQQIAAARVKPRSTGDV